ncbi:MAG: hypothetical protein HGJ94_18315 [Desulfosarcina sp.]|nr:hypothetical protein [Desulfosarcina sp.]
MTVTAQDIADAAAEKLFDSGFDRHATADHLDWINDGQAAACLFKPDISTQKNTLALVEGTYQSISLTAHALIRPVQNLGTDGNTPGTEIRIVDFDHFTTLNSGWMVAAAAAAVELVMFDENDPRHFHCYPQQPSSNQGKISVIEAVLPAVVTPISAVITIQDIYKPLLIAYDLYRAYSIEAKHSRTARADATNQWNLFVTGLGRKDLVEKSIDPNNIIRRKAAK